MDRRKPDHEAQPNDTGPEANPRPHLDTEINQPGPSTATPDIPQEIPVR